MSALEEKKHERAVREANRDKRERSRDMIIEDAREIGRLTLEKYDGFAYPSVIALGCLTMAVLNLAETLEARGE